MARIAFVFPGQGAQAVGMARGLCESLPAARQLFTEAAEILGYDLLDVCAAWLASAAPRVPTLHRMAVSPWISLVKA